MNRETVTAASTGKIAPATVRSFALAGGMEGEYAQTDPPPALPTVPACSGIGDTGLSLSGECERVERVTLAPALDDLRASEVSPGALPQCAPTGRAC